MTTTSPKLTPTSLDSHPPDSGAHPSLECAPREPDPRPPAKFTRLPREERGAELRTQRRAEPAWGARGKGLPPKQRRGVRGEQPTAAPGRRGQSPDVFAPPQVPDESGALGREETPGPPVARRRCP